MRTYALISLCFVLGCVSTNPEITERLNTIGAAPQGSSIYPPTPQFYSMPVEVGQFTQYRITKANGTFMGYSIKVVDEGDLPQSYWFESEVLTSNSQTVYRYLVLLDESRMAVGNRTENFKPQIQDFTRLLHMSVWKQGDKPQHWTLAEKEKQVVRPSFLQNLKLGKKTSVKVPAGHFKGCFNATSTAPGIPGLFKQLNLNACVDSAVPLNAVVEATDSEENKWELVNFGVKGAKSLFPQDKIIP